MANTPKTRINSLSKRFAQIEKISVFGITERMGPLGLHMYAESYLAAAQAVPKPTAPFGPVRSYLVCHAIELALKAFLSLRGIAMVELAEGPYGHNLDSLLTKSIEAHLTEFISLSQTKCSAIRDATTYYRGKVFEYPAVGEALRGYPQLPHSEDLFEVAADLVEALRQPCMEAK